MLIAALRGALFALLAVAGPGVAIQRLLRLRPDPALVIPVGVAFAAGGYGAGLVVGAPWLFGAAALLLDLSLLAGGAAWAEGPRVRGAVAPAVALLALLAAAAYPWNRTAASGDVLLDPLLPEDAAFHAGLAWELSLGYPPEVPGLSGHPLSYHLGLPLVRGAELRYAGVHPYDALSRLDATMGVIALILVLRGAARALGGGPRAEALAPWCLLATDFSFLMARGHEVPWWITLTKGSVLLLSLVQSNAVVLALALALGAVIALGRHGSGEGRGWLLVAAGLGVAACAFKVFVGAQLLLGLGLAALLPRCRRGTLAVALATAAALAGLVSGSAGSEGVALDPLLVVRQTRQLLGFGSAEDAAPAGFTLLWVLCSLGLRLVGVPGALRSAWGEGRAGRILAVVALSGWPLGLLLRVSPLEAPDKPQNEALYFFEQSGLVLWLFAVPWLARWGGGAIRRAAFIVPVAALSLPSTAQFLWARARQTPLRIPSAVREAMEDLARAGRPGDVVLQRPMLLRFPPPPMVLVGRRVPYAAYIPFLTQWAPKAVVEERLLRVKRFFETRDPAEARAIAVSLDARYLCLYGSDAVAFDGAGFLVPIHEAEGARVYALEGSGSPYLTNR